MIALAVDTATRYNVPDDMSREAFAELVEQHHADLLRLAFGMCGDRQLAEDAVQTCWQKAWRSRSEIRDPARIRGWLFTVTANEVRRQSRRRRLGQVLSLRLRPRTTEAGLRVRDLDLAAALRRLSVRDRQIIGMRFGLGLTSDEIGPYVGLSASGTRVRLQRVLERLRRELGDD